MTAWLNRLALALVWVLVTAGVAFLVARAGADDGDAIDVTAAAPRVAIEDRALITLTERGIAPVVSGDGNVMWDAAEARWLLVAPATSADVAYRLMDPPLSVRALIDGGPAGFACDWAGLGAPDGSDAVPAVVADGAGEVPATPVASPSATPEARAGIRTFAAPARTFARLVPLDGSGDSGGVTTGGGPVSGGVTLRCAVPDDVRVVSGLTGTMVLQMERPEDAPALPVSAVVGTEGQGQVVVVGDGGAISVRAVELGRSDTFWIEITGGLEPDERVLEFPTQYDLGPGSS